MKGHFYLVTPIFLISSLLNGICHADSFSSWYGFRGAQVGNQIALQSGLLTNGTFENGQWQNPTYLEDGNGLYYLINLQKSFGKDTSLDQILIRNDQQNPNTATAQYINGAMFQNFDSWYTFGGQPNRVPRSGQNSILTGTLSDSTPGVLQNNNDQNWNGGGVYENITSAAYASSLDPNQRRGWFYGGMARANYSTIRYPLRDNDIVATNTFFKVDMTADRFISVSNLAAPGNQGARRAGGGLVWLPFGTQGILVQFGGVTVISDLFSTSVNANVDNNDFMTNVQIFDIATSTWYNTTTLETSPRPPQMARFCTSVVPSADGHSQQIFVYGGYNGQNDGTAMDDVWVLSIPAFRWSLVKQAQTGSTHGRTSSVCFTPNPNTFMTVGGTGSNMGYLGSDTFVDVLNLTTMEWSRDYDATSNATFAPPSTVVTQLGWPSANGPGSLQVGALGNTELVSLMNVPYPTAIRPLYPYSSPTTVQLTPSTPKSGPNIALIASLCTILPILAILIIVFFCWRRRNKKRGMERTDRSRGTVSSWLSGNRGSYIDPKTEKSHTTEQTMIDSEPDYFMQPKPTRKPNDIYEAEATPPVHSPRSPGQTANTMISSNEPYEIMTHPSRGSMSIHNHPIYPHNFGGPQSDAHSELNSGPISSQRQASPSELPHNRSQDHLAPSDVHTQTASTGMAPGSAIPRKPVSERRVSTPLPSPPMTPEMGHARGPSDLSTAPSSGGDPQRYSQLTVSPSEPHGSLNGRSTPTNQGRVSAYKEATDGL